MLQTYKNNGAAHVGLDGVTVPTGGTIITEEDLIKKFPNKFVVVPTEATAQDTGTPEDEKTDVQKAAEAGAKDLTPPPPETPPPLAPPETPPPLKMDDGRTDVTGDFPYAPEAGVTVRRDKRGWWVFDGDAEPANEKALRKKDVRAFVDELTAE